MDQKLKKKISMVGGQENITLYVIATLHCLRSHHYIITFLPIEFVVKG